VLVLFFLGCAAKSAAPVASGAAGDLSGCSSDMFTPASIPESQRYYAGVTTLTAATTSKEKPVEACGVEGQLAWLMRATCADGSHPFKDDDTAHDARVGNVGPGGRCESIIDLYEVPCPEKTYEIYMDLYVCD